MSQGDAEVEPMEFMEMMMVEEHAQDPDSEPDEPMVVPIMVTMAEDMQTNEGDGMDSENDDRQSTEDVQPIHWAGQSTGTMLGCPECGMAFSGRARLRRHQLMEHGDSEDLTRPVSPPHLEDSDSDAEEPSIKCDHCAAWFSSNAALRQHRSSEHGVVGSSDATKAPAEVAPERVGNYYKCKLCPVLYKTLGSVHRHMRCVHPNIRCANPNQQSQPQQQPQPQPQPQQQKIVVATTKVAPVVASPSEVTPKKLAEVASKLVPCPHCPSQYLSYTGLTRHINVMHLKNRDFAETPEGAVQVKKILAAAQERWDEYIQCEYCSSRYKSEVNLRRHVIAAHSNPDGSLRHETTTMKPNGQNESSAQPRLINYFVCELCSAPYISEAGLRKHQLAVHNRTANTPLTLPTPQQPPQKRDTTFNPQDGVVKCPHCAQKYKSETSLRWHLEAFHGYKKPGSEEPDQQPEDASDEEVQTVVVLLDCEFCSAQFKSRAILQRHLKVAHGHEDKLPPAPREPCSHCATKVRASQLQNHLKTKHRKTSDVLGYCYQCNNCPLNFTRRAILERHVQSSHTSLDTYDASVTYVQCELCPLRFADDRKLNYYQHMKMRHRSNQFLAELGRKEVERPTYNCSVCSWSFPTYLGLQRHLKSKHKSDEYDVEYFDCEFCPMRYATKNQCQVHMTNKHGPDAPPLDQQKVEFIQCEYCPLRYTTEQHRQRHVLKKHKKEMLKECQLCGRRFKKLTLFRLHTKRCTGKSDDTEAGFNGDNDASQSGDTKNNADLQDEDNDESSGTAETVNRRRGRPKTKIVIVGNQRGCGECGQAFPKYGIQFRQHQWREHGIGVPVRSKRTIAKEGCDEDQEVVTEDDDGTGGLSPGLPLRPPRQPRPEKTHVQCEYCEAQFPMTHVLRRHVGVAHPEHLEAFNLANPPKAPRPLITCPLCPSTFQIRIKLTAHIKHYHKDYYRQNECRFDCDFCGAKFAKAKVKHTHMLVCPKRKRKERKSISEPPSSPATDSEKKSELPESGGESGVDGQSSDVMKSESLEPISSDASPIRATVTDSVATNSEEAETTATCETESPVEQKPTMPLANGERSTASEGECEANQRDDGRSNTDDVEQ